MNLRRPLIVAVALLVGAALEIAWQAGPVPAAEEVPQLADRFFRVEWTTGASSQGQTRIVGYVYNESDHDATNVQLRISELDASGRTVRSVIKPTGEPVPAAGRVFFDLQVPGTSPSYRVAVESFGLIDDPWTTKGTEMRMALTSAIGELPPVSRTALVLRDVEGLSNLEIAEALSLSVPIVKARVHRARLFLRKQLGDAMTTLKATAATS